MELTKFFRIVAYEQPLKDDNKHVGKGRFNYVATLYDQNFHNNTFDFDIGDIDELRTNGIHHPSDLEGKVLVVKFTPKKLDDNKYLLEQMDRNDFVMPELRREEVTRIGIDRDSKCHWEWTADSSCREHSARLVAYERIIGYNIMILPLYESTYTELRTSPPLIMRAEFRFEM